MSGKAVAVSDKLKAGVSVFRRHLGDAYDRDALRCILAMAAVAQLDGDPVWGLLVGGPGATKTETLMPLEAFARVVSSIASVGALLSATSKRERTDEASGGLLRELDATGKRVLVIKDFTTLISQNATLRAEVMAALREIYDGRWTREVGTDGGRSLVWQGRLVILGAVTTAWDTAHGVVSSMGDRFVLVRLDSSTERLDAGRHAIAKTGDEKAMRAELAEAATSILTGLDTTAAAVVPDEVAEAILAAADVVTRARTGVEYAYNGDVIDAHAPEMPTRFAKQLTQVYRGARAIGMGGKRALALALRCARDSMPPLRLALLEDIAAHPGSRVADVRVRLQKPRTTVDRGLQALHALELVTYVESPGDGWRYSLARGIDLTAIQKGKK